MEATGFDSYPGLGVWAKINEAQVLVGNLRLMQRHQIDIGELPQAAEKERTQGVTAIFAAVAGKAAGILVIADAIKATTPAAIESIRRAGVRVVMLTGDNERTARALAEQLGVDDVIADVLPEDKVNAVKRLQHQGAIVAMAGDGVNDAPALAQADVGIAMGTGTDVAMESAGETLVSGNLNGIVRALHLSRRTMSNIRQKFAFGCNSLGAPVAAGALYPVLPCCSRP